MLSWLAEKVASTPPLDIGISSVMKEALGFEPVLTPAKELEYKFVIDQIVRSSFDSTDRLVIMDFLHYSFAPVDPNVEWRTIFNGFRILNALIESGCPLIFSELLEGKHFDIAQKTLFLAEYGNSDARVGQLVRSVAREVRKRLMDKFSDEDAPKKEQTKISSISSRDIPLFQKTTVHLGHTEDSSSDEQQDGDLIDVNSKDSSIVPPGPLLDLL